MGRPRDFDEEKAVDQAMAVFWERGFEGTHLDDLLDSTQMVRSSFYRTFGSKEDLFSRCVDRYHRDFLGFRDDALRAPMAEEVIRQLLQGMVRLFSDPATPGGCLETNGALACSPEADSVRIMLSNSRDTIRRLLEARLDELHVHEPLPSGLTPESTANLVAMLIQGLAVMAKGGTSHSELETVVESFLTMFEPTGAPHA